MYRMKYTQLVMPDLVVDLTSNIGFVLLILVAFFFFRKSGRTQQTWKETRTNLIIFLIGVSFFFLMAHFLQISLLRIFAKMSAFSIPISFSSAMACLLLMDFVYYWRHRCEHEVRFFWLNHSTHHSSKEMNFSTALRLPWMAPFVTWVFFLPPVLIGFHPLLVIGCNLLIGRLQFFLHTEAIPKLGLLEGILNTPALHRVHHGVNLKYLNKNYGGVLIIWDRLFGTYQPEEEAPIYGILDPFESFNPLRVNLNEYQKTWSHLKTRNNLLSRLKWLFSKP